MASKFWVGNTAQWDNIAGSKWASTSGGAGGQAVPTASDNVFFDANSGSGTITATDAIPTCNNLDFTGFTGTFTHPSWQLEIAGSMTLSATMTYTAGFQIRFIATSGTKTITSNGKSIPATSIIFLGNGSSNATWQLTDAFVHTGSSGLQLFAGTFDSNGKTVTCVTILTSNSGTRSLVMGSSIFNIGSGNSGWDFSDSSGCTIAPGTSLIIMTVNGKPFKGGGLTYNNLQLAGSGSSSTAISGDNTFNDFKDGNTTSHSLLFTTGSTQTFNTFTVTGTSVTTITINSTTTGTHSLVKSGGGTISCDYLNIQHSVATPANTWYAGTHSTNNQATVTAGSGWLFTTAPPVVVGNAYRDENSIPTLIGALNTDGITTVRITADPSTHKLAISDGITGENFREQSTAIRDENYVPIWIAVSSEDGITPVQVYTDSRGNLLIQSN